VRKETLSLAQARRVALAAQGFGVKRADRSVGMRDVQAVINRLGQFQIDSINVVRRAHYLPLFSRLGPYDTGLLDRAAHRAPRRLFEYWGHAASLIDINLQPFLRFRAQPGFRDVWTGVERVAQEQPGLVDSVLEQVSLHGPVSAREIEHEEVRSRDSWGWNWSSVKTILEWLFYTGEVTSQRRNAQFERVYDLPANVIPTAVLAVPTPAPEESVRELVRRAAQALGIASEFSLRDYFRTRPGMTRQAIAQLVEGGELLPVRVPGWEKQTYLWHEARFPRRVHSRALLSPFDSMVFERAQLEKLFGFLYRIEIYVPEPKRIYGYYVYPFLLGEQFVARVDLKADRAANTLRVNSAWIEASTSLSQTEVARELAAELSSMAGWLGLSGVEVLPRGDLSAALRVAVRF
jgi:uncharacterized protein YcaQ